MDNQFTNYISLSTQLTGGSEGLNRIFNLLHSCNCNIVTSKVTKLGEEIAVMLLISGNWGAIAKVEALLPKLEKQLKTTIILNRTSVVENKQAMAYLVHVITIDRSGIIKDLSEFFLINNICIHDISCNTYMTNTGAQMANIAIQVSIPTSTQISLLREKFISHCDELNIDAGIEPLRD